MRTRTATPPRWWPVLAWALVSLPAFWVRPAIDDWGATAPMRGFTLDHLRPGLFWRPVERLNQFLVGAFPSLYPHELHALAVLGHGAAAWLVGRLARRLGASATTATVATLVFLVHPAVTSTIWSVDAPIRAWSTACGLAATAILCSGRGPFRAMGWLALAGLAALWYEPGVRWFVVAPFVGALAAALNGERRPGARGPWGRLATELPVGLVGFAAYFLARHALSPQFGISGAERYALVLDPLEWMRNAVMLAGVSVSSVDTVALLGPDRNLLAASASALAGLPLLGLALAVVLRTWPPRALAFGACAGLAALAPHLPQAHVSEFYTHPIVAVVVLLLAGRVRGAPVPVERRRTIAALALFAVGAVAVDTHKLVAMVRTGRGADRVGRAVVAAVPDVPERLCVVTGSAAWAGYSVFVAPPGPASDWGYSARQYWGWRREVDFDWVRDVRDCPPSAPAIAVATDGAVTVLRR